MNDGLFKFELTEAQVVLILAGLSKLPLEQSFDLFSALRSVAIQKQQSKNTPKPMGDLFDEEEAKIGMTE
jgi:malate/lactate dehydrogenase